MTILFTLFLFLISIFLLLTKRKRLSSTKNLPPGSLGLPLIGQSLSLLRHMRANTAEKWLQERISKYGSVSKLSLFGKPTVFIHGQAANKLIFASNESVVANQQTKSIQMILGDRNLLELSGDDHKRVRSALMLFLKPESLKNYVAKMEEEIRLHLETYWLSKPEVTVLPLMKNLTFNIICSILFGIERGGVRDKLIDSFQRMIKGMWAVPVNFPFTRYNRSLKASRVVQELVKNFIHERRELLEKKIFSPDRDLITHMLSIRDEENEEAITENEITQNVMLTMVAGHDTTAVVITFMMMFLANEPSIYESVLQEQEEIAQSKSPGESLTWEDLAKMKYTWRVAMETLRMVPPVFGGFRKALKDIEFDGFIIPKGWQLFWASSMTQMDNEIYREPMKFDPDRFENLSSSPPYCFVAFGGGPRMCPGNEFARIETLVAIHYLITRFSWKLTAESSFFRDPTPMPKQGLPIQISQKRPL